MTTPPRHERRPEAANGDPAGGGDHHDLTADRAEYRQHLAVLVLRALLDAGSLDTADDVVRRLSARAFPDPTHGWVFARCRELVVSGVLPSPVTVGELALRNPDSIPPALRGRLLSELCALCSAHGVPAGTLEWATDRLADEAARIEAFNAFTRAAEVSMLGSMAEAAEAAHKHAGAGMAAFAGVGR